MRTRPLAVPHGPTATDRMLEPLEARRLLSLFTGDGGVGGPFEIQESISPILNSSGQVFEILTPGDTGRVVVTIHNPNDPEMPDEFETFDMGPFSGSVFLARNGQLGADSVRIGALSNVRIAMGPGQTRTWTINIEVPKNLSFWQWGDYTVIAQAVEGAVAPFTPADESLSWGEASPGSNAQVFVGYALGDFKFNDGDTSASGGRTSVKVPGGATFSLFGSLKSPSSSLVKLVDRQEPLSMFTWFDGTSWKSGTAWTSDLRFEILAAGAPGAFSVRVVDGRADQSRSYPLFVKGSVIIENIDAPSGMSSFGGSGVTLVGQANFAQIDTLAFKTARGSARINVSGNGTGANRTSGFIAFSSPIEGLRIDAKYLGALEAHSWLNVGGQDKLEVDGLGWMMITKGDFRAEVRVRGLTGAALAASPFASPTMLPISLFNVSVKGAVTAKWFITGSVGSVTVGSTASTMKFHTSGFTEGFNNYTIGSTSKALGSGVFDFKINGQASGFISAWNIHSMEVKGKVDGLTVIAGLDTGPDGVIGGGDGFYGRGAIFSFTARKSVSRLVLAAGLEPGRNGDPPRGPFSDSYIGRISLVGKLLDTPTIVASRFVIDSNIDYQMGGAPEVPLTVYTNLLSPVTGAFATRVPAGLWIANKLKTSTDPLLLTQWPATVPLPRP